MLNATITKRIDLTDQLIIFHIKPDEGVPDFLAGQYLAIGLPGSAPRPEGFPEDPEEINPEKLIKRAYSVGSSPGERDHLELYIAVVPEGLLTPRLACLKEGDRLFSAKRIVGTFTLGDVPDDHNLVLVSTGTGIAPYMAMVRSPEIWTSGRKITIIHGVRYSKDFAYQEELRTLAESNPDFTYLSTVSREDPEWTGDRGYVQHYFDRGDLALDPEKDHVFVCGNPAMIDDVEKYVETLGYSVHSKKNPEGLLHLEKYW